MKTNIINSDIPFNIVTVINDESENLGKMPINAALTITANKGLDLLCVSDNPDNPICKMVDYGKLLYQQKKKEKENKRKCATQEQKNINFKFNIQKHDLDIKKKHIEEFLKDGCEVTVQIRLFGRENTTLGPAAEDKLRDFISEINCNIKKPIKREGNNISVVIVR